MFLATQLNSNVPKIYLVEFAKKKTMLLISDEKFLIWKLLITYTLLGNYIVLVSEKNYSRSF